MAFQSTWYFTRLPQQVVDILDKEVTEEGTIPDTHWIGGFIWHYILRANRENFLYDISHLDRNSIKYKVYNKGEGQNWHVDAKPVESNDEDVRKLSFTFQLSNVDDYEGGNVELLDEADNKYYLPRDRGVVIVFDSRTQHRVEKIIEGTRKSLVGWCIGPQWK